MLRKVVLLAGLILFSAYTQSFAAIVSVVPSQQAIGIGETAEFNILLSCFDSGDPQIEEFNFEFFFDNDVLSFSNATTTVQLGEFNVSPHPLDNPEYIEVEMLEIAADQQPIAGPAVDPWVMATFTLEGISAGTTVIDFNDGLDTYPETIDAICGAEITVVPIPGAFILLLSGLSVFGLGKKIKLKR